MKKERSIHSQQRKRDLIYCLFLLPGLVYLILNNYLPMLGSFIAFKKINFSVGLFKSKWVGLDNFVYLFKTKDAWTITRNTLLYNLAFIVLGTILYVFIAILLCEITSRKSAKVIQLSLLLPYMLSWVIVSYLAFAFLSYDNGIINQSVLKVLNLTKVNWYGDVSAWPKILIIVYLWKTCGYSAIVYMAAISGIDPEIMESAQIDGAGKIRQVWYITLPALKPTITIMVLMAIGRIFYSDFGLFYQVPMDCGALYPATQTIDTYVYRAMMRSNNFEGSAAAGLYQSLVGFVLVMGANTIVRRIEPDNALF